MSQERDVAEGLQELRAGGTGSIPHAGKLLLMMMRKSVESLPGEQLVVYTALGVQDLSGSAVGGRWTPHRSSITDPQICGLIHRSSIKPKFPARVGKTL